MPVPLAQASPAPTLRVVAPRVVSVLAAHGPLILVALVAVFAPLTVVRLALVSGGLLGAAIAVTVLGHVVLAVALAHRRATLGLDGLALPTGVLAGVLVALIVLEVAVARLADLAVGDSDSGLVAGGLVGSLVVAPVWALLLAARLPTRA